VLVITICIVILNPTYINISAPTSEVIPIACPVGNATETTPYYV